MQRMTVEIVNYLGEQASAGNPVFYDIYSEEEKAEDPWKEDTGLFFFRGEPGGKVAICNAGGGFVYGVHSRRQSLCSIPDFRK